MYNGHKNWNCWNVALWLANTEELYFTMRNLLKQKTKDESAVIFVQIMKDYFGSETTPDGAKITFSSIREHLKGVDRNDY
jgi:hypothetical protein